MSPAEHELAARIPVWDLREIQPQALIPRDPDLRAHIDLSSSGAYGGFDFGRGLYRRCAARTLED